MKKTFFILIILSLLSSICLYSQTYQLSNSGFELWDGTASRDEPSNWNAFPSAQCDLSGFAAAGCNTAKTTRHVKSTETRPGSTGSYSCKVFATRMSLLGSVIIANGVITTGQVRIGNTNASSPENYNITRNNDSNFRQNIDAKPDSIAFWVKFTTPSATQNARMCAIIHDDYSFRDPTNSDPNAANHIIAQAIKNFPREDQNWKRYSVPFNYINNSLTPKYILLTFTTNMLQGEGSADDALFIDDIELIYNVKLQSININNNVLENFNPNTFEYNVNLECGSQANVSAIAQSPNANININNGSNQTIITVNSGDKTQEYKLNFHYVTITNIYDNICKGNSYQNNGFNIVNNNILGTNMYERTSASTNNCDSIIRLHLTVNQSYTQTTNMMICHGTSYNFNGVDITEAGTYYNHLSTINGCDSIIILNISVGDFFKTYIDAQICEGETYLQNGFNRNTTGIDTIKYGTTSGCDSLVILNLIVNKIYTTNIKDSIIVGNSYNKYGFNIPIILNEGTFDYNQHLTTIHGCDSIINLSLKAKSNDTITNFPYTGDLTFEIYPIPTTQYLTIKSNVLKYNTIVNYEIIDINTKLVIAGNITEQYTKINISSIKAGVYFVRIIYDNKQKVIKFIIN